MGNNEGVDRLVRSDVVQTYPFEVAMNSVVGVKNLESMTDVEKLGLA